MTNLRRKKKDFKIGFLKYGNAGKTRRSVLIILYNLYIYKVVIVVILYTPVSFQFFFLKPKKCFYGMPPVEELQALVG